jgi:hypothetical protein
MSTLYELTEEFAKILDMTGDEDDFDGIYELIESLQMSIADKLDNYAKVIKIEEGDVAAIKSEIARLQSRKSFKDNKVSAMKTRMKDAMERVGADKIKTTLFNFNIQPNPAKLVINDDSLVPERYLTTPPPQVNTQALKEALKSGALEENDNIFLEQSRNLRIK